MQSQRCNFDAHAESIREARQFVRAAAETVGADPDAAALLTGELATNAVVHAHSPFEIRLARNADALRVEVLNHRPDLLPIPREPSDDGGRGLLMLEALARSWGMESRPDSKAVWFELPASWVAGLENMNCGDA